MEIHEGKPSNPEVFFSGWIDLDEVYLKASSYCSSTYTKQLAYYRSLSFSKITPSIFWSEYVWCVYTSGFNAKVVSKKFDDLMSAYGPWDTSFFTYGELWSRVSPVLSNRKKFESILTCRQLLKELGWENFVETFLEDVDTIKELPFIGNITKYHLGRNLGLDCVKPDIHLERLSAYYGFEGTESLCMHLALIHEERIGVVDYILWAYCAAFGTKDLEGKSYGS